MNTPDLGTVGGVQLTEWLADEIRDGQYRLYRFFDAAGALLYIGATSNFTNRLRGHARSPHSRPWWGEVDHWTVEEIPDPITLSRAEKRAIRTERPRHNVHYNKMGRMEQAAERSWEEPWLTISMRVTAAADQLHEDCRGRHAVVLGEYLNTAPCENCFRTAATVIAAADGVAGQHDETVQQAMAAAAQMKREGQRLAPLLDRS